MRTRLHYQGEDGNYKRLTAGPKLYLPPISQKQGDNRRTHGNVSLKKISKPSITKNHTNVA